MVLALEEWVRMDGRNFTCYDRPGWWSLGVETAYAGGQEVQPLFVMKDGWDLCVCETNPDGSKVSPYADFYGQMDSDPRYPWITDDEYREYVFCPLDSSGYRQDWREGRELTDQQSRRWALHHATTDAHHIFNGPQKEATVRVQLPEANGISIVGTYVDEFADWQRQWLDNLPGGSITVTFTPDHGFDGGVFTADDGRNRASVVVAGRDLEDAGGSDTFVRRALEELDRISGRGGRESGGADSGGPQEEGPAT